MARPARAAPPRQRAPDPGTPARAPCNPPNTPRAARRRPARAPSQCALTPATPGRAPRLPRESRSGERRAHQRRCKDVRRLDSVGARGAHRAHALGRQEQHGQQVRRRVRQQLRRQGMPDPPQRRIGLQHLRNSAHERVLPRDTRQVAGRRSTPTTSPSMSRAASGCHSGRGAAGTSAAHPCPCAQGGVGRARREQLGQRPDQRLGRQRSRLDGAHRHQDNHRVEHRLRAGGCVGGRAAPAPHRAACAAGHAAVRARRCANRAHAQGMRAPGTRMRQRRAGPARPGHLARAAQPPPRLPGRAGAGLGTTRRKFSLVNCARARPRCTPPPARVPASICTRTSS